MTSHTARRNKKVSLVLKYGKAVEKKVTAVPLAAKGL